MTLPTDSVVLPLVWASPFAAIDRALEQLGLARLGSAGAGEDPFDAAWTGTGGTVAYARDYASGLQTLVVSRGWLARAQSGVPIMTAGEAAELLSAEEPACRLAGLQAAGHLDAAQLLPLVAARTADTNATVAQLAVETLARLVAARVAQLPGAESRKSLLQTIRRIGSLQADGAPAAVILREHFASQDWEVRASALLAAGRLALGELKREIANARFAEDPALGLARHEHRVLLALQAAALERVGGAPAHALPEGIAAAFTHDYARLAPANAAFAFSLLEPLPESVPPAPAKGIVSTPHGPSCADGTLLSWVPPGAYWLGHGEHLRGEVNPARRVVLETGFYIESEPRDAADWAGAQAQSRARAGALQRSVAVASEDYWEMAARAADGRRLPWGQNADPALKVDLSPLGMAGMLTGPGEWLAANRPGESPRATPGAGAHPLSARLRSPPDSLRQFRFVYRFDPPQ